VLQDDITDATQRIEVPERNALAPTDVGRSI
jgi:hypothetical protein